MGRKGMKGFMKSASRASSKPEGEVAQQPSSSSAEQPAQTAATPSSSKPQPVAAESAANGAVEAAGGEPGDDSRQESRGQMQQRHKREMLAHKKTVQRMGKKSKDELSKLDAEIEARHALELQQLDTAAAAAAASTGSSSEAAAATPAAAQAAAAVDRTAAEADRASKYLVDLNLGNGEAEEADDQKADKKVTKAQKRREKQAAKHAEREARIAAEQAALGPSEREEEEKALKELLQPLGLAIKEIRADGHCLYRSVEDQLEAAAAAAAAGEGGDDSEAADLRDYQQLREVAANYIREHKDDFAPFLLPDDDSDVDAHFEQYCSTIESTAAWGGHLELQALSHALKRQIKVHAVGMATQSLGDEYAGDGKPAALEVCYLRHAFGLGEHYNSTKKQRFVRFSTEHDYFEHEGDVGSESGEGLEEQADEGKQDS